MLFSFFLFLFWENFSVSFNTPTLRVTRLLHWSCPASRISILETGLPLIVLTLSFWIHEEDGGELPSARLGWLCAFHYTKQTKVMECPLRSLQIGFTVYSKTFQVHLNGMLNFKYKFLDSQMKYCFQEGQKTKFHWKRGWKVWHLPARLSSSISQSYCYLMWHKFQSLILLNLEHQNTSKANTIHLQQKKVDIHVDKKKLHGGGVLDRSCKCDHATSVSGPKWEPTL